MFNVANLAATYVGRFFAAAGDECTPTSGSFFGLPPWFKYLDGKEDAVTGKCLPIIKNFNDFWAIGLAVIDILLRVGGMVAVVYVIYGGFRYMTSQGEPEKTTQAKDTVLNAVIGLVIVTISILVVNFIGTQIDK